MIGLALPLLSNASQCGEYSKRFQDFEINCSTPLFKTDTNTYFEAKVKDNNYFLVEAQKEFDPITNDEIGTDLTFSSVEHIDNTFFYLYDAKKFVSVSEFLKQGSNLDWPVIFVEIAEKIKELSESGKFTSHITIGNILINSTRTKISLIDKSKNPYDDSANIQIVELKKFFLNLFNSLALHFKPGTHHHVKIALIKKFNDLVDFITKLKAEAKSLDALLEQLIDFKTYVKSEPTLSEPDFFVLTTNNMKLYKREMNISDLEDKKMEIIYIMIFSAIILLLLTVTIFLMTNKEANLTEEDYEMKIVPRPSGIVSYS